MKIVWRDWFARRDSESLSGYITEEVYGNGLGEGELEQMKTEIDKLQEVVTKLVERAVTHSANPTRTLQGLLSEEGCSYTVEEDDD